MFTRSFPAVVSVWLTALSLPAQSSNQVWFVLYNGQPTPSSDVAVRSVVTDDTATALATGAAAGFLSQTNFSSFSSPFNIAVDPAMGKVYVLDNNLAAPNRVPEYIYAFNLAGTPAQIAASGQVIYTMPVPTADTNAGYYPLISGLALDPANHFLYFNQFDLVTGTNSYIGRLDLASSAKSDVYSSANNDPAFHSYYATHVPGWGQIAIDATNLYLGVYNLYTGNSGVYVAPRSGDGAFSELASLAAGDTTFSNGIVCGVASDPRDHLVYYLTSNAGFPGNLNTNQNALWVYDAAAQTNQEISSGYPAYPDNIAIDPGSSRYYFTVGQDGSGNPTPTNYQAIYTGTLGSTNAPTLLYTPALGGQDADGQINAGRVVLQGIFVEDLPPASGPPENRMTIAPSASGWTLLFTGLPSQNYIVQSADAAGGPWSDLSLVLTADTNGLIEYNDQTLPPLAARFYRVRPAQ